MVPWDRHHPPGPNTAMHATWTPLPLPGGVNTWACGFAAPSEGWHTGKPPTARLPLPPHLQTQPLPACTRTTATTTLRADGQRLPVHWLHCLPACTRLHLNIDTHYFFCTHTHTFMGHGSWHSCAGTYPYISHTSNILWTSPDILHVFFLGLHLLHYISTTVPTPLCLHTLPPHTHTYLPLLHYHCTHSHRRTLLHLHTTTHYTFRHYWAEHSCP